MILSIIIPVFNGEKYLEDCLYSCIAQNEPLDTYEIICVNDGSIDNSAEIINDFKNKYSNIRLFNQSQGGVSKARNLGLKNAQGDYVWFVDADDFIEENILKDIYQVISQNHPDRIKMMSFSFQNQLSEHQLELKKKHQLKSNYPYKNTQITRTIISRGYIRKHEISFYENLTYGEDAVFNFETRLYFPNDFTYENVGYYYRTHEASATSVNSDTKRKKYIDSCKEAIRIVTNYYNNRVHIKITSPVLKYWINMMLEQYFYYGSLDYGFVWNKSSIRILPKDISLIKLNSLCCKIYNNSDFKLLQKHVISILNKKEKKQFRKQKQKQIIGFFKHPKRLLIQIK